RLDVGSAALLGLAPARPSARATRAPAAAVGKLREATAAFQLEAIEAALARAGGNQARAAKELGLDRANLHRLLARLKGLPASGRRPAG
ncbi:MAG: nitric oxide reductase transcription regulator, partial [Deltaproteobacteria bacterium]|nr:nitric oxide reductase transcription regulator [Deltaproteobacteria bacterium]